MAKPFVHLLLDRLKSGKRCIKETIFVRIPCIEYTLEESFAFFLRLSSMCTRMCVVCVCVRVCLPACRENARVGLLYRCFLFYWNKFIAGLSYRPISSPLSINELFQPVFIVRFSNLSSNVIFSYIVKDQGKGILIVPSGKKGKKYA